MPGDHARHDERRHHARARLFVEYAQWLRVDLCFQGFERELATLPGAYAPPRGRLLLAGGPGEAFGCIALRPIWIAVEAASCRRIGRGRMRRASAKSSDFIVQPAHRAAAGAAGSPRR